MYFFQPLSLRRATSWHTFVCKHGLTARKCALREKGLTIWELDNKVINQLDHQGAYQPGSLDVPCYGSLISLVDHQRSLTWTNSFIFAALEHGVYGVDLTAFWRWTWSSKTDRPCRPPLGANGVALHGPCAMTWAISLSDSFHWQHSCTSPSYQSVRSRSLSRYAFKEASRHGDVQSSPWQSVCCFCQSIQLDGNGWKWRHPQRTSNMCKFTWISPSFTSSCPLCQHILLCAHSERSCRARHLDDHPGK